ncbi:MAG: cellulase family glycosylhydrolase [Polyangiaceae bacterium]
MNTPFAPFRVGLNYWPSRTAMAWWQRFQASEVAADFAGIAAAGFDSVRLFLTWESFQPRPDEVSTAMVDRLVSTLEIAEKAGLRIMPTLFTGHMSGANWIPPWALGGADGDARFRVISGARVVDAGIRNWYSDVHVARAQARLADALARALAGHPALWAWDLGNEASNCVRPATRLHATDWLRRIGDALREADPGVLLTIGLHSEDLEQDRMLGPAQAAEVADFVTMHGYPGYVKWARDPTDHALLPFLVHITRWLAGGLPVLFSEFGVPTRRASDPMSARALTRQGVPLVEEVAAAEYIGNALRGLHGAGATGAMVWCHADYAEQTWTSPPLDLAVHERVFGQWRTDGSAKPSLAVISAFARERQRAVAAAGADWIDIERGEFEAAPGSNLPRLYERYLATEASAASQLDE